MGKLHKLKRAEGEITVQVLHEGRIINGKYEPPGKVHVISGINGEEYVLDALTSITNYLGKENLDFYRELLDANGGKL